MAGIYTIPNHLWLLLLLLRVIQAPICMDSNCRESDRYKHKVPERCKYLLEEVQTFDRKCGGTYPLMAFTKFRDSFVKTGEPFGIYMPNTLDHVMVLMKDSALQNCAHLQLADLNTFFCLDDNNNETIKLDVAHMYCFPFHIQLPDDLMQECLRENDMDRRHLDEVLRTRRGVIHYTFGDSRGHRAIISGYFWPLFLLLQLFQAMPAPAPTPAQKPC
ncbi:uncharacterized protein LOC108110292 [Drosophila eugracilis]|uniref:uncharacterized protein LOC108110292 n=1 Tax=Drosophila eugracilis TaxID=29029 RepID=UPI0007E7A8CF|nr:uncharacterized protein LOC108110292 [Drosophila eugracilis]